MKRHVICFAFLFLCLSVLGQRTKDDFYRTIPLAQNIKAVSGKPFLLSSKTKIYCPKNNDDLNQIAVFLSEYIEIAKGIKLQTTSLPLKENVIVLENSLKNNTAEAYTFNVDQNKIIINGASVSGTFYGVQLLRKVLMLTDQKNEILMPCTAITDYPRFPYRGMMLDVARHFAPVDFVKKFIDLLALHNINNFHWHLTDDQGWRIEVKKYPKLTEIGSKRTETQVEKQKDVYDGKPHSGFYTQNEIKEIVAYAKQRYINVIPEIDLPGHMLAALASYPELGCRGEGYDVSKKWGVSDDVLCVGNEKTFQFIEGVFTELLPLFPSKYYHIGGDECPKKRWEKCPKCQAKITELGLTSDSKHSVEQKLQSYCISRVEKFLNSKGKSIIGWDEILEGGLAPNATVMSWHSSQGGIDAVKQGHDAIMTPNSFMYFDHYQSNDTKSEPLANGGYTNVERVYSFEPVPENINETESRHIIGAQANLWREYIQTSDKVEYMVLPRLTALSEVLWTDAKKKEYNDFLNRLSNFLPIYDALHYNYAKHVLQVSAKSHVDFEKSRLLLTLKTSSKNPIYYTTDGTEPSEKSAVYTKNIVIKEPLTIKAAVIGNDYKSKVFEQSFYFNKATLKTIVLKNQPIERYKFNGPETLVDAKTGTMIFSTGDWLGFYNQDFEAVIDLKSVQQVSQVSINSFTSPNDWIFGPKQFLVYISQDGVNFTKVSSQDVKIPTQNEGAEIQNLIAKFTAQNARYIKIAAPVFEKMPDWHFGAGQPTFLFVDEISIN